MINSSSGRNWPPGCIILMDKKSVEKFQLSWSLSVSCADHVTKLEIPISEYDTSRLWNRKSSKWVTYWSGYRSRGSTNAECGPSPFLFQNVTLSHRGYIRKILRKIDYNPNFPRPPPNGHHWHLSCAKSTLAPEMYLAPAYILFWAGTPSPPFFQMPGAENMRSFITFKLEVLMGFGPAPDLPPCNGDKYTTGSGIIEWWE